MLQWLSTELQKRQTKAATSMGLGTTANNLGMLAIGVNNAAGLGDH